MIEHRAVFAADEQSQVAVDVARWLRLVSFVLDEERVPPDAQVALLFVAVDQISELNEQFLEGEGPTDVLAFPIDGDPRSGGRDPDTGGRGPGTPAEAEEPPTLLGDVLVCPAVAAEQARRAGHTLDEELALLVVHGTLHLLDYDHAQPEDEAEMRRRERELIDRFMTETSSTRGA